MDAGTFSAAVDSALRGFTAWLYPVRDVLNAVQNPQATRPVHPDRLAVLLHTVHHPAAGYWAGVRDVGAALLTAGVTRAEVARLAGVGERTWDDLDAGRWPDVPEPPAFSAQPRSERFATAAVDTGTVAAARILAAIWTAYAPLNALADTPTAAALAEALHALRTPPHTLYSGTSLGLVSLRLAGASNSDLAPLLGVSRQTIAARVSPYPAARATRDRDIRRDPDTSIWYAKDDH